MFENNEKINKQIRDIENEDNINSKLKFISKLHKLIDKEQNKLNVLSNNLESKVLESDTKYDDMKLEDLISKFEKSNNFDKKIKYYHAICNNIDNIIESITIS